MAALESTVALQDLVRRQGARLAQARRASVVALGSIQDLLRPVLSQGALSHPVLLASGRAGGRWGPFQDLVIRQHQLRSTARQAALCPQGAFLLALLASKAARGVLLRLQALLVFR